MATITPISVQGTSGQVGFFNKYPYTDFHELNLDWLLTSYQAIIDKTNETISWVNNHQIEYEEAIARLSAVENEIETFEAQITAAFNKLEADLTAELEKALADTIAEVDATITQLRKDVAAAIAGFENRFLELETQIKKELAETKAEVARAIALGVTYTPSISADGILSWTNDGGLENPAPIKILGSKGENGTSVVIDNILEN